MNMKTKINGQLTGYIDISDLPIVVEVIEKKIEELGKNCDFCGKTFVSEREEARYCSKSCRQKAYYYRHREKEQKPKRTIIQRLRDWIANKLLALSKKIKGEE
jgi:hypothetical protein